MGLPAKPPADSPGFKPEVPLAAHLEGSDVVVLLLSMRQLNYVRG